MAGLGPMRIARFYVVRLLELADEAIDEVLYRPAVVKAFEWMPRWWGCQLAKLSLLLDDCWGTGLWQDALVPGPPCEACGRRAAIHLVGGWQEDDDEDDQLVEPAGAGDDDLLRTHSVSLCGWCSLDGAQIRDIEQLRTALARARARSVSWRWRWASVQPR